MTDKEKGSDAMLPQGAMQHIKDSLYAEERRLNAEQLRVERSPAADEVDTPPQR